MVPVAVLLAWWTSDRAKPDMRQRGIQTEIDKRQGSAGGYDIRSDGGPAAGGGGF